VRRLVPKNESFLSKRYQKGLFSLVSYALYLCVMKGRELFRLDRFEDSVVFLCYHATYVTYIRVLTYESKNNNQQSILNILHHRIRV
jgi:hypothetical protein